MDRHAVQVLGVLVLCPVGAELLAAYGDSTGDPAGIAFALVFFAALYGAPALLARELVRRRGWGWGWPSLLLVFAALGVAQACLIDQSLFSADYQDYEGWEETREATLIPALGISAYNSVNFVVGHLIYSFAAPVALVEAWRPQQAHTPWLRGPGIAVAAAAYLGAVALLASDPTSRSGSAVQLAVSALVTACLVSLAVIVGRRRMATSQIDVAARAADKPVIPVGWVLGVVLILALVGSLGPETWGGLILGLGSLAIVGVGGLLASRRTLWTPRHCAAVALAFLLARGLAAFLYYPLLGEVGAGPKYAHNVVMLGVVLGAGWLALRPAREASPRVTAGPGQTT